MIKRERKAFIWRFEIEQRENKVLETHSIPSVDTILCILFDKLKKLHILYNLSIRSRYYQYIELSITCRYYR